MNCDRKAVINIAFGFPKEGSYKLFFLQHPEDGLDYLIPDSLQEKSYSAPNTLLKGFVKRFKNHSYALTTETL